MSSFPIFEFTEQELSTEINNGMERVIYTAAKDNIITKEQYDQLSEYKVIVGKPTLWGRVYAKLFPKSQDGKDRACLFVVKVERANTES